MASQPIQEPFSLNDIKQRFNERDIEIIWEKRTITVDICLWHSSDDTGVMRERGINISIYPQFDDCEQHEHEQPAFHLEHLDETPHTFDTAVEALCINPDEKVWTENRAFDSTTEEYE